jgi:hypothetical protein
VKTAAGYVLLPALLWSAAAASAQLWPRTEAVDRLEEALRAVEAEDAPDAAHRRVLEAALEADNAGLRVLLDAQRRHPGNGRVQRTTAMAIAFIGGPDAVEALMNRYYTTRDPMVGAAYLATMGTLQGRRSRGRLTELLEQPPKDEGEALRALQAVLTLGVRRSEYTLPLLRRVARQPNYRAASEASVEVLRWLTVGPWLTPQAAEASADDAVILAAFRHGIPTYGARKLYEADRRRVWSLEGRTWRWAESARAPEEAPMVDFQVHRTANDARALLSIRLEFESGQTRSYDYVFRRKDGKERIGG